LWSFGVTLSTFYNLTHDQGGRNMKLNNGPIKCPYCGCLSAYYEIDRIAELREKASRGMSEPEWEELLQSHKKRAFCLMCHKTIELPKNHK
jgi:hypothetical protein